MSFFTKLSHIYGPSVVISSISSAGIVWWMKSENAKLIEEIRRGGRKLGPDSYVESGTRHIKEKPKSASDDVKDIKSMIPINGHHVTNAPGGNEKPMRGYFHTLAHPKSAFNDAKDTESMTPTNGHDAMNAPDENEDLMTKCLLQVLGNPDMKSTPIKEHHLMSIPNENTKPMREYHPYTFVGCMKCGREDCGSLRRLRDSRKSS
ncbi:hypothetical protein HOY80DRAFT_12901 [Tuber brumale]|nr:hypothetical protein HOY80DRAFT_12901 [Tuber brumale]